MWLSTLHRSCISLLLACVHRFSFETTVHYADSHWSAFWRYHLLRMRGSTHHHFDRSPESRSLLLFGSPYGHVNVNTTYHSRQTVYWTGRNTSGLGDTRRIGRNKTRQIEHVETRRIGQHTTDRTRQDKQEETRRTFSNHLIESHSNTKQHKASKWNPSLK